MIRIITLLLFIVLGATMVVWCLRCGALRTFFNGWTYPTERK